MLAETYGSFYLGLKYNAPSQVFEWISGEAVTYTDAWEHYEPGRSVFKNVLLLLDGAMRPFAN